MARRVVWPAVVWPAVLAVTFSCNNPSANPSNLGSRLRAMPTERPTSLNKSFWSGLTDPTRVVIADAPAWSVMWADLTSGIYPPPELPVVDFRTHRVIVAALGTRPTGGFVITVDSLVEFEQGSLAFVTSQSPGGNCGTVQVLTQPVDVVLVSIPRDPVSFRDRSIVHSCE